MGISHLSSLETCCKSSNYFKAHLVIFWYIFPNFFHLKINDRKIFSSTDREKNLELRTTAKLLTSSGITKFKLFEAFFAHSCESLEAIVLWGIVLSTESSHFRKSDLHSRILSFQSFIFRQGKQNEREKEDLALNRREGEKYYVTIWSFLVFDVQWYPVANHIDSIILNVS